jgi:uncharacterized protein YodC (DUF2158 family)
VQLDRGKTVLQIPSASHIRLTSAPMKSSSPAFEVGDTVTLRSGGPLMTISALSMSLAYCVWFGEGAIQQTGTFELDLLEHVVPPPAEPPADPSR